jgi:hypothetical protein
MSFAASLLHLACIVGGGDWYRFFGAGERMARLDEAGSWTPAIITAVIAIFLAGWGLYALSGAGIVRRVPLLRTGLGAIAIVLLARTSFVAIPATWGPGASFAFMAVTSAITGIMGLTFAVGTTKSWAYMRKSSV